MTARTAFVFANLGDSGSSIKDACKWSGRTQQQRSEVCGAMGAHGTHPQIHCGVQRSRSGGLINSRNCHHAEHLPSTLPRSACRQSSRDHWLSCHLLECSIRPIGHADIEQPDVGVAMAPSSISPVETQVSR